jgi:isoquinoline 1-oxidoreductase beta subunit
LRVSRRIVLLGGGVAGLVLGIGAFAARSPKRDDGRINAWVALAPDGIVTVRVNASDLGQGAQTGIAQIVADEMDADWAKVRIEMAPVTDGYMVMDGDDYYTGGSSSIRAQWGMFAKAGATARAMLIAAAAKRWNVLPDACSASAGVVTHRASGRTIAYGALASDAAQIGVPEKMALKAKSARTLIGRPLPRRDIPEKVDGRAIYGIDLKRDGMLIATVLQCPVFGGTLGHVDEKPALAVRGALHVVRLDNAVAVVARNFWAAKKGLQALSPQWTLPAVRVASEDAMMAALRANIGGAHSEIIAPSHVDKTALEARVTGALKGAVQLVEAEYSAPLLAHAPMEPMNATAHVTDGACEMWAPMQAQHDMRDALAKALHLSKDAITLHTTLVGGGFGRRLETDYGVQAALISQAVKKPVKLIWTREEDFAHDFYRPACVTRFKAALDGHGTIRAIEARGAATNDRIFGGLVRLDYAIPDVLVRFTNVSLPLAHGAWRSVDASINGFFVESLVDEAAHAARTDPLLYRRALLAHDRRGLRVLDTAAAMANWGHAPPGRFQGIAYFGAPDWGTAVCEIVELSVDAKRKVTLHKAWCAIDPGEVVNPGAVAAQAEGGMLMGLSAALAEKVTIRDGRAVESNFDSYRLLSLRAAPDVEVRVLESAGVPPGGAGEPPVPPAAAALANAIFAATGERVRALPLSRHGYSV